ncbi:TIGR01212 family radical SAM protein [Fusibacter tunisiensis]|uniref:Radical SAM protein (TIGR01212 family) n=1 Tax=Fusibacter tunisiensis TaxID=1008308 RepID=A0ABS2MTC5_9FIRM|nr:TIGR01212 family radical SAM protein [Fusibacter tunisiensis]MBM7562632.1 radical SAM protein (TIGR01212 family) [Fusibacter tunisiensis]
MNTRYTTIGNWFKETYQMKVVKLAIDGGFTCPNRDGTLSTEGCLFCNAYGSGEYSGVVENGVRIQGQTIEKQIESQKQLISKKWCPDAYLAYFQNFTNTYGAIPYLKQQYDAALNGDAVMGLVIATRPDCITEEIVKLIHSYTEKHLVWVELGLQSSHSESLKRLKTQYTRDQFERAFKLLADYEIKTVVHLILGLENETKTSFLETVAYVNELKPFGVKMHMLNVLDGTELAKQYLESPFPLLTRDTYIEWICDGLEWLNPQVTIHRVTGDGIHEDLIAPLWIKDKRKVLNGIMKELKRRNTYQGFRLK